MSTEIVKTNTISKLDQIAQQGSKALTLTNQFEKTFAIGSPKICFRAKA